MATSASIEALKLGYIHIFAVDCPLPNGGGGDRTASVALQPELTSELAFAAVGYEIADLRPERTIVVADVGSPQCWVFSGYLPALRKIAALVRERGEGKVSAGTERPVHLVWNTSTRLDRASNMRLPYNR